MDSRAFRWLRFVTNIEPIDVLGAIGRLPEGFVKARSSNLSPVLVALPSFRPRMMQLAEREVVALFKPQAEENSALRNAGFDNCRSYAVVPNLGDPRLILPLDNPRVTVCSLSLYSATTWKARALRLAAITAIKARRDAWYGDSIVVASRSRLPIEEKLSEITGFSSPVLSYSIGRPQAQAKVTVGVMDSSGRMLAFIKVGTGEWVRDALRNEAKWLRRLAESPLTGTIPHVLDFDELGDTARVIVSPGPDKTGQMRFVASHESWLKMLKNHTVRLGSVHDSSLAHRMHHDWPNLRAHVTPIWRNRVEMAVQRIVEQLAGTPLPLSASHGDFAPWNTRQLPNGRLYVFDWEMAQDASLPLHDRFHFAFMSSVTRGKPVTPSGAADWLGRCAEPATDEIELPSPPVLFAAYLVDLALTYLSMLKARSGTGDDPVLSTIANLLDNSQKWWPE